MNRYADKFIPAGYVFIWVGKLSAAVSRLIDSMPDSGTARTLIALMPSVLYTGFVLSFCPFSQPKVLLAVRVISVLQLLASMFKQVYRYRPDSSVL